VSFLTREFLRKGFRIFFWYDRLCSCREIQGILGKHRRFRNSLGKFRNSETQKFGEIQKFVGKYRNREIQKFVREIQGITGRFREFLGGYRESQRNSENFEGTTGN
jgi:hypothetical protein